MTFNTKSLITASLCIGLLLPGGYAHATGGSGDDGSDEDRSGSNQAAQSQQQAAQRAVLTVTDAINDSIDVTIQAFRFAGSNVADSGEGKFGYSFNRDGVRSDANRGSSAGDNYNARLAFWVNGGYSHFEQDNAAIQAEGDVYTGAVGGDWQFNEHLIAGLSVAYDRTETDTVFNNGEIESDGYFVAPYFAALLGESRNILWDGLVGYGVSSNDVTRNNGATTGSFDSDRWVANTNVSYLTQHDGIAITPRAGLLWYESTNDGYTETGAGALTVGEADSELGRVSAGIRFDYIGNPDFIPHVSVDAEYDFESEDYSAFTAGVRPPRDEFGARLGAGAQFRVSERVAAHIDAETTVGRENYSSYAINGRVRVKF